MSTGLGYFDINGVWIFGEDDSETLMSDLLNKGQDATSAALTTINSRLDDVESGWQTWTTPPTNLVVGTGGAALLSQRHLHIGGGIHLVKCDYILGTSGASVGLAPIVNLWAPIKKPIPRYATLQSAGALYDASAVTQRQAIISTYDISDTQVYASQVNAGALSNITSTSPWTWAAGDILHFEFTVEVA